MNEELQTQPNLNSYSRIIKASSWMFTALTALVAIAAFFFLVTQAGENDDAPLNIAERIGKTKALAGLVFMPVGGYILGMALAVLFAPASYLQSSDGKKWMDMVGTKTVFSARVVSLVFVLFGVAFLTILILALITDDFKKPVFARDGQGAVHAIGEST